MKKVKKMADGGMSSLGGMIPDTPTEPQPGGGGGGGSAFQGLDTIGSGSKTVGDALSRASSAIGSGGGGQNTNYKKGGQVTTTRRVSTVERSKKCGDW